MSWMLSEAVETLDALAETMDRDRTYLLNEAVEHYLGDEDVFLANYSDGLTDLPLPQQLAQFREQDKIASFLCVLPNLSYHMVSVEEIDYMPEFIEEVREETGTAARRFHRVLQRARRMAEESGVKLDTHVIAGHPVRDIVELAKELNVELLVIGATGHSALYGRLIGSRADRIVQLAHCPVLVVK